MTDIDIYSKEIQEMIKILENLYIEMKVGGCGCCNSPWITFIYKGKVIVNNEQNASFCTEAFGK